MTKVKRVIEIEESDYELSCQRYGDARYNGYQPDYENTAIAQSVPYNPTGGLTEAEKIICKVYLEDLDKMHTCNEYKLLMSLIDNAQPVETRPQCELRNVVHGLLAYKACNKCNAEYPFDLTEDWILCPRCGAEIQKGGVE